jgi:hypothetical protein
MRLKYSLVAVLATFALAVALPAAASAAPKAGTAALPVSCVDASSGAAAGCTAQVVGFTGSGSTLSAVVEVTNTATGATTTITQAIAPQQPNTCTILDLVIPPIHLELLGLVVDTDTIHLRITAQRGSLLGNLLCGLFFPNQTAGSQSTVLNQFLRQGMVSASPV